MRTELEKQARKEFFKAQREQERLNAEKFRLKYPPAPPVINTQSQVDNEKGGWNFRLNMSNRAAKAIKRGLRPVEYFVKKFNVSAHAVRNVLQCREAHHLTPLSFSTITVGFYSKEQAIERLTYLELFDKKEITYWDLVELGLK